jgi:hypothetical protein
MKQLLTCHGHPGAVVPLALKIPSSQLPCLPQEPISAGPLVQQQALFPHSNLLQCFSGIFLQESLEIWVLASTVGGKTHNKGIPQIHKESSQSMRGSHE